MPVFVHHNTNGAAYTTDLHCVGEISIIEFKDDMNDSIQVSMEKYRIGSLKHLTEDPL